MRPVEIMALLDKKIAVLLPAYNAARTLERTYREIPEQIVDYVLLVDDASGDETVEIARRLGVRSLVHEANRGYGANQKTCFREALTLDAEVFVLLHADYQYTPRLIPAIAAMIVGGPYELVLGSRILGGKALAGGMPLYKYAANRVLTLVENWMTLAKLSEYHTGFRAFSRKLLETVPFESNSDDFVFDNQIILQALYFGFQIGEISCPARYFPEASSINFARSVRYGFGVLAAGAQYRLQKWGLAEFDIFRQDPIGIEGQPPRQV